MGCNCSKKVTTLKCKQCGRLISQSHDKNEDPIEAAKKHGRKCQNDFSNEFEILP